MTTFDLVYITYSGTLWGASYSGDIYKKASDTAYPDQDYPIRGWATGMSVTNPSGQTKGLILVKDWNESRTKYASTTFSSLVGKTEMLESDGYGSTDMSGGVTLVTGGGVIYDKVLRLSYGGSTTDYSTENCEYWNGVAKGSGNISLTAPSTYRNYAFTGFSSDGGGTVSGRTVTFSYSASDATAVASYTEMFTVAFNANGGSGTMSNQSCTNVSTSKLNANTFTRDCYAFTGWNTSADGTGTDVSDKETLSTVFSDCEGTAGGTITLYAQWEYTAFNVTVSKSYTGGAVGVTQPNIGTLKLVCIHNGTETDVATEDSTTHELYYEGTANESSDSASYTYRVDLVLVTTKPDALWESVGITNGGRITGNVITPIKGDVLTYTDENSNGYVIAKKALYSLTLVCDPVGSGTATVTDPSEPDESGKYVSGRDIEITETPTAGYELSIARGRPSGKNFTNIQDNKFTYDSIDCDDTLTLYFEKITYTATVEKDSASSSAISAVSITGSSTGAKDYQVGDTLTLNATVASGYTFDGWYVDGTRVSTSATYSYSGTGTKTFVAKAKVSVTLGVTYTGKTSAQQESCTLRVNDASYTPGTAFDVILGQSFSYELVMGAIESGGSDLWKFNAWFNSTDVSSRSNPLAYGLTGTITPTAAMNITAEVTAALITNVITIVMKEDENQGDISCNGVITTSIEPDAGGWDSTQSKYILTFYGTKSVKITSLSTVPSTLYAFNKYVDGTTECSMPEYEILTSGDRTITAWYGSTGTRTTTLAYGTSGSVTGDRTMGTFEIASTTDPEGEISSDKTSAEINRGYSITILAKPKNGYSFRGWYTSQNVGGDAFLEGTEETMVISTNRNLFAWFAQDSTAVYEWEGTGNMKSFEWRSKLYKAAKPFNPSCCRVDTEGYPLVEMDVEMFSAPDTAYTARTVLQNIASQTARRLPVRRPERYMQVCVKNDKEVDAVYVGTNMSELAQ